ncbi:hypothetical protein [Clostridium sp.]|uniref:hypothetical protein n=1 Tax=Clostridium sp. TaxID=1506 RepID=UPI002639E065|nr:hypothetical protein [Clostridium sp.]
MRKNIKNVIAIGIILSAINSSIVPAFASDNTGSSNASELDFSYDNENSSNLQSGEATAGKTLLTLDKAIEAAINNSDKLTLKSREIKYYQDKMDFQEKSNDFYEAINQKVYDYPYDKLKLQEKQTEQSKEFLKDQIVSDITNKFNDIYLKQIDIDKSKRNLELKKNDLDYLKGKLSLGMSTDKQVNDALIELRSLQDDITAKENLLNDSKDYFKVLTDLDLKNTYELQYEMNYTKFKIDGSIDDYIDNKLDTYFKYDNKILDLTKDYLKDLKDDGIKDVMDENPPTEPDKSKCVIKDGDGNTVFDSGTYALSLINYEQELLSYYEKLNSYGSYLDGKYNYNESKVKLEDTKKSLINVLKENYSTLLDLENKIDRLKEQVNSTNTKLRFAKAQVDMGLMLQNDYDKQVLASNDLDTSLIKLVNTHSNLRDSIEKPWILSNK